MQCKKSKSTYYIYVALSYIELIDMPTFLMQIYSCNSQLI